MRPTRIGTLVAVFLAVAAGTWGVLDVTEDRGGVLPPLPWSAAAAVLGLGIVVLLTAIGLRNRLRRGEKVPHPLAMARMAVLGKASAHVGPVIAGLYAGYGLVLLPTMGIEARRERAVVCAVAVAAALLLAGAGLLLERICRVRGDDRTDDPSAMA
jgi:hypothetical protein